MPVWDATGLIGVELYAMDDDAVEEPTRNIVEDESMKSIRKTLSEVLTQHFGTLLKPKEGGSEIDQAVIKPYY